jgi:hypothetical protein
MTTKVEPTAPAPPLDIKTELTPIGEQYIIPGCEKAPERKPKQGTLWD